ncbi:MAG: indole-3-glycerol phosphate synthase TrpC [Rikenellaceae bacterium]
MNILEQIIAHKKMEVAERKETISVKMLERSSCFERNCYSLKHSLLCSDTGIIAEFKRKSPSKGWIYPEARPEVITPAYQKGGASGLSILTDTYYFGSNSTDITSVRHLIQIPILRKDFIIGPYQIFEAKAMGADVILLIAAILKPKQTADLTTLAKSLGLEVLLELHNAKELEYINPAVNMVGINNRDLKTFKVNLDASLQLHTMIPDSFVKISESGISNAESVITLRQAGFRGFLMGENFMKTKDPGKTCAKFVKKLQNLENDRS